MLLSYLLLGAATLVAWLPQPARSGYIARWSWQMLLAASLLAALAAGQVGVLGACLVIGLCGVGLAYRDLTPRVLRTFLAWVAALMAVALATHRFPGFVPLVLADLQLTPSSAPMVLRAHLDKGMAGLVLLACFTTRSTSARQFLRAALVGLAIGLVTAIVVVGAVVLAGAVRFDPKLPAITLQWLVVNLFLTCIFEEALFRGLLQERLARALTTRRGGAWIALGIASLLFGLAHAGGDPLLVAAAAAAGAGYGLAYQVTGRIEASVVAHFTLNTVHFLGFTYPYASA